MTTTHVRRAKSQYFSIIFVYACLDAAYGSFYVIAISAVVKSPETAGGILALASVTVAIVDFPSGVLADRFGRLRIASLGLAAYSLGVVAWAFAEDTWVFAVAAMLWGSGVAFISGAPSAWLVDTVAVAGDPVSYKRILPIGQSVGLVGGAATGLVLGIGPWISPRGPLVVLGVIGAVAAGLMLRLPDNFGDRELAFSRQLGRTIKAMRAKEIVLFAAVAALFQIPFKILIVSWQLTAAGSVAADRLGIVFAAILLVSACGGFFVAREWPGGVDLPAKCAAGAFILSVGTAGMSLTPNGFASLGSLIVAEFGVGIFFGAVFPWMHREIISAQRSSLTSGISAISTAAGIAIPIPALALIDRGASDMLWAFATVSAVAAGALVLMHDRSRRWNRREDRQHVT